MKKNTRIYLLLATVILYIIIGINTFALTNRITIEFNLKMPATIINDKNEKLIIRSGQNKSISGNMKWDNLHFTKEGNLSRYLVDVDENSYFKYIPKNNLTTEFSINGINPSGIIANNVKNIVISNNINNYLTALECNKCHYNINGVNNNNNIYYSIDGSSSKNVSVLVNKKNLILRGASDKINLYLENDTMNGFSGIFYTFGKDVKLNLVGNKITATNAIIIPSATTKDVSGLSLRPVNDGKNLFLTWNKVKGAKSYVVYQYNYKTKKYYQVAIRKGNGGNYYNISNVKNNTYYNYVIRASKSSNGKSQFITKQSYPVSSLSLNSKAGNVSDIKINSKNITGKVGKKIQLKAKISNNKNQKLYNKSLRWYSTNKNVVAVDNHTGKITLKKKGSAKIWVKAHNGRNSLSIRVVVK